MALGRRHNKYNGLEPGFPKLKRRVSTSLFALSCLGFSACPALVSADESLFQLPLETLLHLDVTSASKSNEKIYEAPAVISVMTRQDIARYGGLSLRDAIGRLPGILLLSDGDIQNDNLGIRGDSVNLNNHLLLLINGHPFRSTPGASDAIRRLLNSFPLDLVDKIEFIRGPGSALYGASAYTGVINVITRKAETNKAELKFAAGSNAARLGSASMFVADPESELNLSMNIEAWKDDGWTATLTDVNNQEAQIPIGDDYRTVTVSGQYHALDFTLFAGNRDSDLFGQRLGFAPGELEDEHSYASVGYTHSISADTEVHGNLSWLHLNVNDGQFGDDEYVVELDLQHRASDELGLLFGLTSMKAQFDSELPILQNFETEASMLYAQAIYELSAETQLVAGIQANRARNQTTEYVPRYGLSHQFSENWGSKLLYSEAYRSPNAIETGTFIPGTIIGNTELEPETVETLEFESFFHRGQFYVSASAYYSKQRHLIAPQFNSNLLIVEYQNANERKFYGTEASFEYKANEQLSIEGSVSIQRNKQVGDKDLHDITTQPRWFAKLGLSYLSDNWSLGVWDNYVDDYRNTEAYSASKLPYNPAAESYHNISAKLEWLTGSIGTQVMPDNFSVSLFVQNLLDQDIRQHSLTTATPLNSFPSDTDRAIYLMLAFDLQ